MTTLRGLRACMVCSYVQNGTRFQQEGCPNCDEFLEMRGNSEAVFDCTSAVFEGTITLTSKPGSWVAKWQRLEGYRAGVYAIKIEGNLPDEYLAAVENAGVKYVPRDGSAATEES